jgi:hypothetical protein
VVDQAEPDGRHAGAEGHLQHLFCLLHKLIS